MGSAALSVALLLAAAPAGAVVTTVEGQKYGVAPHVTSFHAGPAANPFTTLEYGGGAVLHTNATYAIYWDPAVLRAGDPGRPGKYHGDWMSLINGFLEGMGSESGALSSVFALTPQYTDVGGGRAAYKSTFRGAYVDHDSYPPKSEECTDPSHPFNKNFACFTDQQVRTELRAFVAANGLHAGPETIFYVLTPPGVTICTDAGTAAGHCSDSSDTKPWEARSGPEETSYANSFCSYHSDTTTSSSETLLYAVIPWTAGTLGSALEPTKTKGSDCQDGTEITEEPNQAGLAPDGYYDHGLPDVLINQIAAQQMATITDPLFTGWNEPINKNEVPDQCRDWFEGAPVVKGTNTPDSHTEAGTFSNQTIAGHEYYLNTEYNQAGAYYDYPGLRCELHTNLVPSFTAPNAVKTGQVVGFDGNQSDVTLEQSADATPGSQPLYRATFAWNFGDGSCGDQTPEVSGPGYSESNPGAPLYASVFHHYAYGGTYQVTLTITDAAGNKAPVTLPITVEGSPSCEEVKHAEEKANREAEENAKHATEESTKHAAELKAGALPAPVATAGVSSRSLRSVLAGGLVVRYSVNEQVAGHFEVLLASSLAKRIGLHGPAATGLAKGTPPQIVIARAILVTTTGGRNTVKILFGKYTASHLRRLRKVSLMLRLVVHNASPQNPASTTVLSVVNLTP